MIKPASLNAYKNQLPHGIWIHYILHTTKMKPVRGNQHDANNDDEQQELFYNVDSIVSSITRRQKGKIPCASDKPE